MIIIYPKLWKQKKLNFCIRKESNSDGICLEDQYGLCFFVLEHLDIMWIRSMLHQNSPLLNNFILVAQAERSY